MAQLWSDKKRTIFGLPLSFTRYTLTEEKFIKKNIFIQGDVNINELERIKGVLSVNKNHEEFEYKTE